MRRFYAILTLVFAACFFSRSATITGPIYLAYSNRPYSGQILLRPLSTPLPNTPNLVTGGDFKVSTDTNGTFSVELQPGNYRVTVGADRGFTIDVPNDTNTYTLLSRITNSLAWNSQVYPYTNIQSATSTEVGVVKTYSTQSDPVVWTTNDIAAMSALISSSAGYNFDTMTALLASTAPSSDVGNVTLAGWASVYDGRGGDWYYDYGATTTTNTGMVVAWGSGRLYRKWDKEIDPRWFGADDSCSADAAVPLQAAIDFAARPTYGWQMTSGESNGGTNNSAFSVVLQGCFRLDAPIYVRGGVDLTGAKVASNGGDYGAHAAIQVKHGGHGFIVDFNGDQSNFFRQSSIRNIAGTGYSETYQQNKKSITGVTSRTVFKVADADAPPTLDDVTIWESSNTCFFFDNEGAYIGSGRVLSTSSSAGETTVTLATGSDVYTSVNGSSGNLLTTACKVVWPVRPSDEVVNGISAFSDPSAAGSCFIYLKNTRNGIGTIPLLENIFASRFHTGLRIGPNLIGGQPGGMRNLVFQNCRFAGIATPRPIHTADMFFQGVMFATGYYGADYGTSRTNTADIPALRYTTYGLWGVPALSKWDSALFENCAYANVYSFRTINPSFGLLFVDNIIRYGLVLGPGYYAYSGPTTSASDNWFTVDRLLARTALDSTPIDTLHTNQTAVYFELTDTAKFAGLDANNVHISKAGTVNPALTYAFDLQASAYNNRAKIGAVVERNGFTTWSKSGSKFPEVDTPQFTSASEVNTGWYDGAANQRDFAVSGTRLLSITSGNLLAEKAGGSQILTLKNTTSGSAIASTIGTGSITWDNTSDSLRLGSMASDSSQATLTLGTAAASGTTRASFIKAESAASGVSDKAAGTLYIFGSGGTGSSTSGGDIQFWTFDAGASSSSVQSSSLKFRIPRVGGFYTPGQASDPSALTTGHTYFNSTYKNWRFYDGSYWQPLSVQSDEASVASSSTVNLGFQTSDKVYITGTTTINSFGAALAGTRRNVRFEGALTLTYNASSMVLPGAASITTAAGDTLEAQCISTGNWRVIWYQRASGTALVSSGGVSDGDKGDITVSGSGANYAIDSGVVTYAKMQNVSAASKLLGRGDSGSGSPQEITLGSGLSMSGTTLSASASGVATDAIWDAAGDIAYGTGANTASVISAPAGVIPSLMYYGPNGIEWVNSSTHFIFREEFILSTTWQNYSSGGAGYAANSTAQTAGVWEIATGTASSTGRQLIGGSSAATVLGEGEVWCTWRIKIPTLSNGTDRFNVMVGLIDSDGVTDGVYFRYSDNENSGNWTYNTESNTSVTTGNTSTAVGTGWVNLTINVNAAGTQARFYVGGTLVGTDTGSTIPTGAARITAPGVSIIKTAGTASARVVDVDFVDMYEKFTTAR